ncbi:response regulator [Lignipirellula cremea]|uniref:Response regulator rcp1 n=1 Tax=Lignipirellula cremea TaxID=2528010 RepID=A0A518DSL5_9BACT|nr:response regulator [Lignipirellula cremea]QDU94788.1 Response regulator rcp1 [Lignipirellula cremea]
MPPFEILLVDDDPIDVELTRRALKKEATEKTVHVANDGLEAMEFLRRQGRFADAPQPDLVLLDLNMPRMNGYEVLDAMKSDPGLQHIPVVVLTTSEAETDIMRSYSQHANSYVAKPVDLEQFHSVLKILTNYWFHAVKLPPRSSSSLDDNR